MTPKATTLCIAALLMAMVGCESPTPYEPSVETAAQLSIIPEDARTVVVVWTDAPPGSNGYRLTWSRGDGHDGTIDLTANARSTRITCLDGPAPLDVILHARNGSALTTIASASWVNEFIPDPPSGITIERTGESTVDVRWTASPDPNVTSYLILWSNGYIDGLGMRSVDRFTTRTELPIPQSLDIVHVSVAAVRGTQVSPLASKTFGDAPPLFAPENIRAASMSATSIHYARVFMKPDGTNLLHGTYPNRYIELEISYQTIANLPYAKRIAGTMVNASVRR